MEDAADPYIRDDRVVYRRGWPDPDDIKGVAGSDVRPVPAEFILDDGFDESGEPRKKDRFSAYVDDEGVTPRLVAEAPPPPGQVRRPRSDAIAWEIPVGLIRRHGMDVIRSPQAHPPGLGDSHVDVVCASGLTLSQRKHQRDRLLEEVGLAEGEEEHLPRLAHGDDQQT